MEERNRRHTFLRRALKAVRLFALLLAAAAAVYGGYMLLDYHRIPDGQPLSVSKGTAGAVSPGVAYTAVTYNIGRGVCLPDYTDILAGGRHARANSAQEVRDSVNGSIETLKRLDPDMILLQEVDLDANRSLHINEYREFVAGFYPYDSVAAVNQDSPFLLYPLAKPIGKTKSCMATFSRYSIRSALRHSLPVPRGLKKLTDLDRCYSVSEIPVDNGNTLYLYNVHLSKADDGGRLNDAQLTALFADMQQKLALGGYVVCGGDFERDLPGDSAQRLNGELWAPLAWAPPFPLEMVAEGLRLCNAYPGDVPVPSARSLDKPSGVGHVLIQDGFLISENVRCVSVENIDCGFAHSHHNPVRLRFVLEDA